MHASIINGGRELSSYPDSCTLQMERRTVSGEDDAGVAAEMEELLGRLRREDPEFEADARVTGYRAAYCLDPSHRLPQALGHALGQAGRSSEPVGMSFWTDAALLAGAGIPSILFGPGGAGLHSAVEYVNVDDVYLCRDILCETVKRMIEA
jgi:acetylornithine deacetylase